ncbi:MAG: TetR/AcrR family transcriptional regulator [Actinobacteria bacterium]|nr:TetR/AcrR family transcriptional regulator [Actinomycetota bacterium]
MKKDENARRILEEAERLAFEVGYRRFNMDDLAQRLRISKKTIYETFSSKDELFTTVLNRRAGKILRRVQEILDLDSDAMTKLYLMSKHVVDEVSHIKPSLVKEVETYFPDVFDVYGDFYRKIVGGLTAIIEEGARNGEFRTDVNPVVFAYMVQGIVDLSSSPYLLIESGLSLDEVYTAFMKILMEGIVKKDGEYGGMATAPAASLEETGDGGRGARPRENGAGTGQDRSGQGYREGEPDRKGSRSNAAEAT